MSSHFVFLLSPDPKQSKLFWDFAVLNKTYLKCDWYEIVNGSRKKKSEKIISYCKNINLKC